MKNPVDTVKVSERAKDRLIRLKSKTRIENWNVLCRWALCTSLSEPSVPPPMDIKLDSNIEIPWRIFGGEHADVYTALMLQRCIDDGLGTDPEVVANQFKMHLHRGIGYLATDRGMRSIDDLFKRGMERETA